MLASGPLVAASVDCRSSDGANEVVSVWDLRGRPHPIKRASSDGNWLCVAGGRSSGIGAFVLSRWGSIAWTAVILDCSAASCAPASTVWRWDALSPIQVEAGPGRVSDLRLDGIRLTWVRDGVPGSTAFDAYRTPDQRYP